MAMYTSPRALAGSPNAGSMPRARHWRWSTEMELSVVGTQTLASQSSNCWAKRRQAGPV